MLAVIGITNTNFATSPILPEEEVVANVPYYFSPIICKKIFLNC
jgi:hypothetical protein